MLDTPNKIEKQSQQGGRDDGIIQREMTRLREQGIQYGRAATLSVDSDRLPTCQVKIHQEIRQDVAQEATQEVIGDENETLREATIEETKR